MKRALFFILVFSAGCAGRDTVSSINVVPIHAYDYAYNAPNEIPSGLTRFELINHGQEGHHLVVFSVPDTMSVTTFFNTMKGGAAASADIKSLSGPEGHDGPLQDSTIVPPTRDDQVTMWLDPGRYMLGCMVPVFGKEDFHLDRGMFRPLLVTDSGTQRAEPPFDAVVTMRDHAYEISGGLQAGQRTLKIVNEGPQEHNLLLDRLHPGKTMEDLFEAEGWLGVSDYVGGISRLSPGEVVYLDLDLEAGRYVFYCVLRDVEDGRSHWEHGMVDELIVAE